MPIGKRVKELRLEHHLTQSEFGKICGVTDKAVSTWENGTAEPRMGSLQRMADYFGLTISDLLQDPEDHLPANAILPSARSLPIIGTICAGDGIVCEDDFQGHFIIDLEVSADYCLRVHGDSMVGADIFDGDIVFIKRATEFVSGKIYAVEFNMTKEASLKKVDRDGNSIVLTPCNPEYNVVVTDLSEIRIVGSLVGVYHSYV